MGVKLWEVQIDLQDFFGCCWSDSWGDRSDYLLKGKKKHKRRKLECLQSHQSLSYEMGYDILYIFDDYFDPQNSRDLVDEEYDHEI